MITKILNNIKEIKNCIFCLLRNNCRLREIVKLNEYVFKSTLNLKSISIYSESYNSIGIFCKLFVRDDIKELSLPSIDLIDTNLEIGK